MLASAWRRQGGSGSISSGGGSAKRGGGAQRNGGSAVAAARIWRWQQHDSTTSAEAWQQHGGGGSISGGGGIAKHGGGAQRNGGSAVAAARMLWRWRQHDFGGGGSPTARRWRQLGGGLAALA